MLAEPTSLQSESNNKTEALWRNLLGFCPKPLREINTSCEVEEGVGDLVVHRTLT